MKLQYKILIGKAEGKRRLETLRRGWKDNVRMHLKELGNAVLNPLNWTRIGSYPAQTETYTTFRQSPYLG